MSQPIRPPSAAPRWPILVALVSAVLGAHLVLLAEGIGWPLSNDAPASASVTASSTDANASSTEPAAARPANVPRAAPVQVSTVRWILPAAATPTQAPAPVLKPKPQPQPVVRTAPVAKPTAAPAPAPVAEAAPDTPTSIDTQTDAASPTAQANDTPGDAAPVPPMPDAEAEAQVASQDNTKTAATDTPSPSDDALLVAASSAKSRPTAATAPLPPAQPPGSMRLQYDVDGNIKGIGYKAHGALDWSVSDGHYDARLEMRVMLLGSRSQTSSGRIGPGGLLPERFADKSRSEKATHFDSAQQRIRFSSNAPEVPLQAGAQDRLSLFMQLAGLLQARPQAYTSGQTIEMQVAGTGDAPVWRFDIGEESTLRVPAGEFRVRHIVRQPRKEFDSTVEMWLAPSLGHMPVRLRIAQSNGDFADQKLMQMP